MDDFISRQAAIAAIHELKMSVIGYDNDALDVSLIYEVLGEIPAADVQPVKRGKDVCDSITDRHCEFKCSLCGEEMLEVWCDNEFNYCPFCGAIMQEEE